MMTPTEIDWGRLEDIIDKHRDETWALIPLLQDVQEAFGYIPPESIEPIADAMNIFPSQVQGVVTFYAGFSLEPKGKYVIRVCRGTACHVRGGKTILKLVKQQLGIEEGETTPDMEYTLETVACIGVCALAPNMVINRATHGHMNPKKVALLFRKEEA